MNGFGLMKKKKLIDKLSKFQKKKKKKYCYKINIIIFFL